MGRKRKSRAKQQIKRIAYARGLTGCESPECGRPFTNDFDGFVRHRLKRGTHGGTYADSNVVILCAECHERAHAQGW